MKYFLILALLIASAAPANAYGTSGKTLCVQYASGNTHQVPYELSAGSYYPGDVRDTLTADIPKWHAPWNVCDQTIMAQQPSMNRRLSLQPTLNEIRFGTVTVCVTYPREQLVHQLLIQYDMRPLAVIEVNAQRNRTTTYALMPTHDAPWNSCDVTIQGEI
jgi:hypothetical protein